MKVSLLSPFNPVVQLLTAATLRAQLEPAAFEGALAEGRALTLEPAVELVRTRDL